MDGASNEVNSKVDVGVLLRGIEEVEVPETPAQYSRRIVPKPVQDGWLTAVKVTGVDGAALTGVRIDGRQMIAAFSFPVWAGLLVLVATVCKEWCVNITF